MNITTIDRDLLEKTSKEAKTSPRKRMNHNFHQYEDVIQRFLNAVEPESYIRPHRHLVPPKDEIFLIMRGRGMAVVFENDGRIKKVYPLDASQSDMGLEVPAGCYHTIFSLEPGTVFYEIKKGPFDPTADKGFASWAPEEGTEEAAQYLRDLKKIALTTP